MKLNKIILLFKDKLKELFNEFNQEFPNVDYLTLLDVEKLYEEHNWDMEGKEYNIVEELSKLDNIILIRMGLVYNYFIRSIFDTDIELNDLQLTHIDHLDVIGITLNEQIVEVIESDNYYFNDDIIRELYINNLADGLRLYTRFASLYNKRFKLRNYVSILTKFVSEEYVTEEYLRNGDLSLVNVLMSIIIDWYERTIYPIIEGIEFDNDLPLTQRICFRNAVSNIIIFFDKYYTVKVEDKYEAFSKLIVYTLYGFYNSVLMNENTTLTPYIRKIVVNSNYICDYIYDDLDEPEQELYYVNGLSYFLFKQRIFKECIPVEDIYVYMSYIAKLYMNKYTSKYEEDIQLLLTENDKWK